VSGLSPQDENHVAANHSNLIDMGDIDHPGCAAAILSGLSKKKSPSFLIHLTGTGCISDERDQTWEGKFNPHIWHDIEEIKEIYDLPDSAQHHVIDRDIMNASNDLLRTAIICPPDIFGQNTGIGNRATFLVPEYIKVLLEKKEAFYLGSGENMRAVTHINDVVDLFLILLGKAIEDGGNAQWGKEVGTFNS
jgi:nucleoside-diphosphate-sugar epimerase